VWRHLFAPHGALDTTVGYLQPKLRQSRQLGRRLVSATLLLLAGARLRKPVQRPVLVRHPGFAVARSRNPARRRGLVREQGLALGSAPVLVRPRVLAALLLLAGARSRNPLRQLALARAPGLAGARLREPVQRRGLVRHPGKDSSTPVSAPLQVLVPPQAWVRVLLRNRPPQRVLAPLLLPAWVAGQGKPRRLGLVRAPQ
jgi:hypothetical protein